MGEQAADVGRRVPTHGVAAADRPGHDRAPGDDAHGGDDVHGVGAGQHEEERARRIGWQVDAGRDELAPRDDLAGQECDPEGQRDEVRGPRRSDTLAEAEPSRGFQGETAAEEDRCVHPQHGRQPHRLPVGAAPADDIRARERGKKHRDGAEEDPQAEADEVAAFGGIRVGGCDGHGRSQTVTGTDRGGTVWSAKSPSGASTPYS